MNFLKNHYILLILLSFTCFVQFILFNKNKNLKKVEDELNNKIDRIENCIDIDNKNKRSIYENLKLSEYCIDNFIITK
tara:strand:- start:348 stop:581 length:234 start_codon:yes stop_codon:yes gene_type:complete